MDSDELYKSPQHASFIKNMWLSRNENASQKDGTDGEEGDNAGVFTPAEANEQMCALDLPAGENRTCGFYEAKETNEAYIFVHNSRNDHSIHVIDGYTSKGTRIVVDPTLNFQYSPEHYFSFGRCVLRVECYFNTATQSQEQRKYLIFTDYHNFVRFISVTDAIATQGFKTQFFVNNTAFPGDIFNLGIVTPNSCIKIEPVVRATEDTNSNQLTSKAFQFRVLFIDEWNRKSEHGIISDLWYSQLSSCSTDQLGQSRCARLTFDCGDVTIKQIQIEYRVWDANDPETSTPTSWFKTETINKWNLSNPRLQWYERTINPDLNYDLGTNRITYTFCADKGTEAIDTKETSINSPYLPPVASTVFNANQTIGLANHIRGFAPWEQPLLDKVGFSATPPSADATCVIKARTITVYAIIRTVVEDAITTIFKDGNDLLYGAADPDYIKEFKQILPLNQTGFMGGFVGETEVVFSTQGIWDRNAKKFTEIPYSTDRRTAQSPQSPYVQRFVFTNAKPGKHRFVVYNQSATQSMNYQATSIACMGTLRISNVNQWRNQEQKEIWIDKCEGDFDSIIDQDEVFEICDLTQVAGTKTNVATGYVYEDQVNKLPVDNALLNLPYNVQHPATTDRNGFYFAVSRSKGWQVEVFGNKNCSRQRLAYGSTVQDAPGARYRDEGLYVYQGTVQYPIGDRVKIKGRVVSCDNTASGLSGVLVWLTNGQYAISDEKGYYTIISHDQGGTNGRITGLLRYASVGLCSLGRCDDQCSSCFDDSIYASPACTGLERIYTPLDVKFKVRSFVQNGPQNGGRYELGILPYYNIGQCPGVQRLSKHAVDLLTISETKVFGFSTINYSLPTDGYPLDVRYFTFAVSKNLNFSNFLTWIADKVQPIDNTGNANSVAPTQFKIYYNSLIEYNAQNGEATNAVWDFLVSTTSQPVVDDQIEFVVNGDGNFFTKRIDARVKFDKDGLYVLVDYTDDLKDLKEGAQIKLLRPVASQNTHLFYEICKVIKVTQGRIDPSDATGTLNYFDAYMLNPQIPIPLYTLNTKTNVFEKDADKSKSVQKTFTYPFEHHSPSYFWGDHAANRGRVYVVDPFQNRRCLPTEISLSYTIANDGYLNGLSRFAEINTKSYDEQEFGSITVVNSFIRGLQIICQQSNFDVPLDDNTIKVVGDTIVAKSLDERLGTPQAKRGNSYGCHMEDINTIREYQGLVIFIDRSQSALAVLYGQEQDVSNDGFKGYLKDKVKYMIQYNNLSTTGTMYFHGMFDPRTNDYILTSFMLPKDPGTKLNTGSYVNNLREKSLGVNETFSYNPFDKSLNEFCAYTAEYMGSLTGHEKDNQLLSFKNGQPYIHHKSSNPVNKKFLEYYGVKCEAIYEVVMNYDPNTVKRFLYSQILCREVKFFSDQIITEAGQRSRLLLTHWEKRENFWTADFKGDLRTFVDPNTPVLLDPLKRIYEGNPLGGKWIKVRYVYSPEGNAAYFEFDGVNIFVLGTNKTGISK